jgi:hypothetical protein
MLVCAMLGQSIFDVQVNALRAGGVLRITIYVLSQNVAYQFGTFGQSHTYV